VCDFNNTNFEKFLSFFLSECSKATHYIHYDGLSNKHFVCVSVERERGKLVQSKSWFVLQ